MDNKEKKLSDLLKQDEFYLSDLFKIFFTKSFIKYLNLNPKISSDTVVRIIVYYNII